MILQNHFSTKLNMQGLNESGLNAGTIVRCLCEQKLSPTCWTSV